MLEHFWQKRIVENLIRKTVRKNKILIYEIHAVCYPICVIRELLPALYSILNPLLLTLPSEAKFTRT